MSLAVEQKSFDKKAAVLTIAIHAVVLLVFLFIRYQMPSTPPPEEMGMEVNIGTSADGYGTEQPLVAGEPAPDNANTPAAVAASDNSLPQDMMQSDADDAPVVNHVNTNTRSRPNNNTRPNTAANNNRNTQPSTNRNQQTQQRDPRYVYNGGTGTGGNGSPIDAAGSNEGNTTGNGDRGVPNGTPGATNYTGTPGSGSSFNLNGRQIISRPSNFSDYKESGKVVVHITVNRQGIVTSKRIVSSSNANLSKIALDKTDELRYNKSDNVPVEQSTNITFVFKTRS